MVTFVRTLPSGMAVYGARPAGERSPGIIVIQHAPGIDTFLQTMVGRLAEAGYNALAPDLYHRQPAHGLGPIERMNLLKDAEVTEDVAAAADFLRTDPAVDAEHLAILGYCMGGRVAYLMAAAIPGLRAAVVYYGGNTRVGWRTDVSPLARTREIRCPVLFHFGAEDTNPSPQDRELLDAELMRHGKAHTFYTYPGAGHAFMNFSNAERYRRDASEASWPRTLAFLKSHLGQ